MHRQPAPLGATAFAFTGVDTDPDREATGRAFGRQVEHATGRLAGSIEQYEIAVTGVVGPCPAVARQHALDELVMLVELMAPMSVAVRAPAARSTRRCR